MTSSERNRRGLLLEAMRATAEADEAALCEQLCFKTLFSLPGDVQRSLDAAWRIRLSWRGDPAVEDRRALLAHLRSSLAMPSMTAQQTSDDQEFLMSTQDIVETWR